MSDERRSHLAVTAHAGSGAVLAALAVLAAACGCAGYHIGNQTLYSCDIHTIYVPMFESTSFRRDLAERLTEAVIKEIQLKTPFHVVDSADADSILSGRIVGEHKHVTVQNSYGDPRDTEVDLQVEVQWIDRHRDSLLRKGTASLSADAATVTGTSTVMPEVGQSIQTGFQQAIQRAAQQIVAMMEQPW
jgi:hypothetical protein